MKNKEMLYKQLNELDDKYILEVVEIMEKNKNKNKNKWVFKYKKTAVAAVLVMALVIAPNTSPAFAKTLGSIPLVGRVFEVITINQFSENDGLVNIEAKTPNIDNIENNNVIGEINKSTQEYIDTIILKFKEDTKESFGDLDINHEVVADTEDWFSLKIMSTETMVSSAEKMHYYNIDKKTGEFVVFADLFDKFDDSKQNINNYIVGKMKKDMEENDDISYFIKEIDNEGFDSVKENQEFYKNENGEIVISFDEYEIAPGYMGVIEFTIPKEVIK